MENKIIDYINQTPENTNPSVLATLLGELKVPKPLTYDYMPEGYPSKTVQTTTLMEEQEVAFEFDSKKGVYAARLTEAPAIAEGLTYLVNWDGTEYECVCSVFNSRPILGNLSIVGEGHDTGEPFIYIFATRLRSFVTLDSSASHTISVKTAEEIVTPIAEEFLPNIPADKLPAGGVTTLHINVTAVNMETMEATFTADKTPAEMDLASANGPVWCVVTFAAGILSEDVFSVGVPPAWDGSLSAFGGLTNLVHGEGGNNTFSYVVREATADRWVLDVTQFGS